MSATGAVIMGVFAALWWVVGVRASDHGSMLTYGIPVFVIVAIIVAASRRQTYTASPSPQEHTRRDRLIMMASGAEGLLIFVAVNVLVSTGKGDLIAPVVSIVVGLHFLPLARWLPARLYYATASLLVGLGIAGFSVPDANQRLLWVSIGGAGVLWVTCAAVLVSGGEQPSHARS
jgi:hypothetical protein